MRHLYEPVALIPYDGFTHILRDRPATDAVFAAASKRLLVWCIVVPAVLGLLVLLSVAIFG